MHFSRYFIWASISLYIALFSACSPPMSGNSKVSLQIPSLAELSTKPGAEKIGVVDRSWDKACFMVNVTGPGIPASASGTCGIAVGAFSGSAPAGSLLSVSVSKGQGRKFEVLAYFRRSLAEVCPTQKSSLNDFELGRTALLGVTTSTIAKEQDSVDVSIRLPAVDQTVVTQYYLPATCDLARNDAGGPGLVRFSAGAYVNQTTVPSSFKVSMRIAAPPIKMNTTINGFKVLRRGQ